MQALAGNHKAKKQIPVPTPPTAPSSVPSPAACNVQTMPPHSTQRSTYATWNGVYSPWLSMRPGFVQLDGSSDSYPTEMNKEFIEWEAAEAEKVRHA